MSAIATTERTGAGEVKLTDAARTTVYEPDLELGMVDRRANVIESTADQSWAEFCSLLDEPAFLLAITGFADL